MLAQPSHFFAFPHLTAGRRGWVATQVKRLAEELQMGPLAARCDEIITVERGLYNEVMGWSMVAANVEGSAMSQALVAADQRRDGLLSAFEAHLEGLIALPNALESRPAEIILKRLMPSGSSAILTLSWPDVSALVDAMVHDLKMELHADVVAANLESWASALESENATFNAHFSTTAGDRQVAWTSLRTADNAAHERFLELVAFILDLTRGPGQGELRERLLAPVVAQQRELKELLRGGRPVPQIDPDDGLGRSEP